jgi:hypothetical protein
MVREGLVRQSLPVLDNLCQIDPEFLEAQMLLADARHLLNLESAKEAEASVLALGGAPKNRRALPKWAAYLRASRRPAALTSSIPSSSTNKSLDRPERSRYLIHQALLENPTNPLAAITHLKHIRQALVGNQVTSATVENLAQAYHQRWPRCISFTLVLAECLMDSSSSEQAVELVHQAASMDVTGQVAGRLWQDCNPFKSLWPDVLEVAADGPSSPQRIPVPAAVAAMLGWNQLPITSMVPVEIGTPTPQISPGDFKDKTQEPLELIALTLPESLQPIQEGLEKVARQINQSDLAHQDGRFPMYVIFTTRQGLENQYGIQGADQIDVAMRRLLVAISNRKTWGALLYYPDSPQLSSLKIAQGQNPVPAHDPWALKLALIDLDKVLAEQGEMIGAALIAGGPEIVPFHRLPNPIDDDDAEVLSDNPYASRDENYFAPEWPVGRLPGGNTSDPTLLLCQLQAIAQYHTEKARSIPWYEQWLTHVKRTLFQFGIYKPSNPESFGFSAAIWRRASLSVFRPIGEPRSLRISPPHNMTDSKKNGKDQSIKLPDSMLGYFNLHGLPDASEWYGQRDPNEPGEGPDFPMALRPEDIGKNGNGTKHSVAPEIVFSEACYGAHILDRTADQAIALKFLLSGSLAVVGSTCISYGSISTPLIAADLLGRTFWHYLGEGYPAGEALQKSKIYLAKEMNKRQGYLDGEDQKTLISFVLYGDPLVQTGMIGRGPKSTPRNINLPVPVATVCDRIDSKSEPSPVPGELMAQVKTIVSQYLPGMVGARVAYAQEHASCHSHSHICPTALFGSKTLPGRLPTRQVVTLSKRIVQASHTHSQYARITLDAQGKLVKLVVSR